MVKWFSELPHPVQALIATGFTYLVTALGAAVVFFFKRVNRTVLDMMLGFAAGVMTAASYWSLLAPSIERADELGICAWLTVAAGFMTGGGVLYICGLIFGRYETKQSIGETGKKRTFMLILSITLHNIPEGLAVGVAFGSLAYKLDGATLAAACLLALGIGLQNFPEGTSVSVPLRRDGYSRKKAFFTGQASGIVEPIAGVAGALIVQTVQFMLPFLLAFAAGAMIFVVVQELIPESQSSKQNGTTALFTMIGFSVMMVLDVALG